MMTTTTITNFRNNIFDYINQAIDFNDVINIVTKKGNAIVISEEDYNGMLETLYIMAHPKTAKDILDSMSESPEDAISAKDVEW